MAPWVDTKPDRNMASLPISMLKKRVFLYLLQRYKFSENVGVVETKKIASVAVTVDLHVYRVDGAGFSMASKLTLVLDDLLVPPFYRHVAVVVYPVLLFHGRSELFKVPNLSSFFLPGGVD